MHSCALAFHLWKLDFQSLVDHNWEEERKEKGESWRLLLESLYNMHPLSCTNICSMPLLAFKDPSHWTLCARCPCLFAIETLALIVTGEEARRIRCFLHTVPCEMPTGDRVYQTVLYLTQLFKRVV